VKKYGIQCDLKNGFMEVAYKKSQVRDLEEEVEQLQNHNFTYPYELFGREKTQEILGTNAFVGSMINYRDGHLHPLNLCIGEAGAAHGLGVQIFEQSPVADIRHVDKPRVITDLGYVDANIVILAGNAYHALEPKTLAGLTFPAGSYIIATEPLSDETANEINSLDAAVTDLNNIVDYFRLSTDKRLLYGGACNYSGREPSDIKAAILPRMLKIYPQLKHVRIDYEWGGSIGIVLNRIPLLGTIGKNVYYCQGYSGHGVNATHVMGEVMADAIGGTLERFDLFAKMKHHALPGSQWFGNQVIALGMLYYRMRDFL
jgi:glycine/D-amino acid oxidase-like deaminating enzyme